MAFRDVPFGSSDTLRVVATEGTVDAANNRSQVVVSLILYGGGTWYAFHDGTAAVRVNGSVVGTASGSVTDMPSPGTSTRTIISSAAVWVTHDSAGNATVSFSGHLTWPNFPLDVDTGNGFLTLTSIPQNPSAPGAPTFSDITATSVDVAWTAPSSGAPFTQYNLQLATNSNFFESNIVWEETGSWVTSYNNASGLPKNTTIYARVRASNSHAWGDWSAVRSFTTSTTVPSSPTGLSFSSVTGTSMVLSWNTPSDTGGLPVTGYVVQRALNSGFSSGLVTTNVSGTSLSFTGLAAVTTYYFRVAAVNSAGTSGYSSTASRATVAGPPGAPVAPTVDNITSSSAVVSYAPPSDNGGATVTGYDVQRSTSAGFTTGLATTSVTGLSCTFSGLSPGVTYYVRVRAKNSAGAGAWSDGTPFHVPTGWRYSDGTTWRDVIWWIANPSGTGWRPLQLRPSNGGVWQ